jgi:alpha-tubulin suppressor-like RCC1 family protein
MSKTSTRAPLPLRVTGLAVLTFALTATLIACGDNGTTLAEPDPQPDPFEVTSVAFAEETDLLLEVGEEETLEGRVNEMRLDDLPEEAPLPVWSSSDSEVAVVSSEGVVTAVGEGEAAIELEVDGLTATRELEVAPAGTTVGSDGGILVFSEGALELEFPEGAVATRTRIHVEPLPGSPAELGLPEGVPGSGWRIGPAGGPLAAPARGHITIEVQNTPPGVFNPMLRVHQRSLGEESGWSLIPGDGGVPTDSGDRVRVSSEEFEIDTEVKIAGIRPSPATQVSAGSAHACALSRDDTLFCWGANEAGQVREDPGEAVEFPLPGPEGLRPRLLASGAESSCAVDRGGELWCWGRVAQALGGGGGRVSIMKWPDRAPVQDLTVGQDHACALDEEGKLWCWGGNERGQLGSGSVSSGSDEPVSVEQGDRSFVQVDAGAQATFALDDEGRLYAWGGLFQEDSDGDSAGNVVEPMEILQEVTQGHPFVQVAAGANSACALDGEGEVWCWGDNSWGQRGTGTAQSHGGLRPVLRDADTPPFSSVALPKADTGQHVCARDEGGSLWCWGRNERGQLGTSSSDTCRSDGSAGSCSLSPVRVPALSDVGSFSLAAEATCASSTDEGRLFCWGANERGQSGNGNLSEGGTDPVEAATGRPSG